VHATFANPAKQVGVALVEAVPIGEEGAIRVAHAGVKLLACPCEIGIPGNARGLGFGRPFRDDRWKAAAGQAGTRLSDQAWPS
jgi:hypothetical protein